MGAGAEIDLLRDHTLWSEFDFAKRIQVGPVAYIRQMIQSHVPRNLYARSLVHERGAGDTAAENAKPK
jgi:hypothetical protein